MNLKNLVPSIWNRGNVPVRREEEHPFSTLQHEMNRIFDDFFQGWDMAPARIAGGSFNVFQPSIDVKENDSEIVVLAELPGLEEKDIEVLLTDDTLTVKGEKKQEKEEKDKTYYHMERTYGSFQRVIPLPIGIDQKKVKAQFKNGVLSITLQKTGQANVKGRKITIQSE
jgi:HSP20 family protein